MQRVTLYETATARMGKSFVKYECTVFWENTEAARFSSICRLQLVDLEKLMQQKVIRNTSLSTLNFYISIMGAKTVLHKFVYVTINYGKMILTDAARA